jgi:hypothetical protein
MCEYISTTGKILDSYVAAQPLERIKRFRNELRELNKRWENCFVPEREGLVESYQKGRFEIVIYGEFLGTSDQRGWAVRIEKAGLEAVLRPAILQNDKTLQECGGRRYENLVVLVDAINQVQSVKIGTIPVTARLYFVNDQLLGTRECLLYRVESGSVRYKFLEFSPEGEVKEVITSSALARQAGGQMVKGRSQVVNHVPDNERQAVWDWLDRFDNDRVNALVEIHENFVKSSLAKRLDGRIKLSNIMIGPLNF